LAKEIKTIGIMRKVCGSGGGEYLEIAVCEQVLPEDGWREGKKAIITIKERDR